MSYPRTAKVADAIIINSESLRREVMHYLDVDPAKLHLIPEAVDHEVFRPGDTRRGLAPRQHPPRCLQAVCALRVLVVAVQELRRIAARLRGRQVRSG